jgi:hypothetical protein
VQLNDFDGDGWEDFAWIKPYGESFTVDVFLNRGDRTFSPVNVLDEPDLAYPGEQPSYWARYVVQDYHVNDIDINQDGLGDIVSYLHGDSTFLVFLSREDGGGQSERVPSLQLMQNHPNPFNPSTRIDYVLPHRAHVTLSVHDIRGERVAVLEEGTRGEGKQSATWDGTDAAGSPVSSGVYIYTLETGDSEISRKMVLVR